MAVNDAPEPRLLIVSNRLPVTIAVHGAEWEATPSTGGLATGLATPHAQRAGLWFGWPGSLQKLKEGQREAVLAHLHTQRLVPIELSDAEVNHYYSGFANGVLWPVFHYFLDRLPSESHDWEHYRRVNERFADVVAASWREGDVVWVHDYQLMLVPALLRQRLPQARIGFFLHIPFPSSEVFRVLPWRAELLRGLLGADLVGFHTLSYMRHFAASLLRILGIEAQVDRVAHEGREVRIGAYPMGIDFKQFDAFARDPEVQAQTRTIRAEAGSARIVLGVDRLDYTKGIPRRLLAFERLLETEAALRGKVQLVQIAVLSRADVRVYQSFKRSVDEMVGRINGRFGTPSYTPIRYVNRGLDQRQVSALYLAADVMLVTPLRDGLNLVAKEFIACRADLGGMLVVSEFAGTAAEMPEALSVNPYDVDGVAATLARALAMEPAEREARMRSLRAAVAGSDVDYWVRSFLADLELVLATSSPAVPDLLAAGPLRQLLEACDAAPRLLLFLDYDGTLVPFAGRPELAVPDADLLDLLAALAGRRHTEVHLVSGRTRDSLEQWFGQLPVSLHAEHGLSSRRAPGERWITNMAPDCAWKDRVRALLERVARHVPGSFLEDKTASLAWHYRRVEPAFASGVAMELRLHLLELLSNVSAEVVPGDKVVEVRPQGVHKGSVIEHAVAGAPADALVVAIGDDATDEDLFAAVPRGGVAIHVGPGPSAAGFRLADVRAVRRVLWTIATRREVESGAGGPA